MNLIEQSEQYVSTLLKDKLPSAYVYHNFDHTVSVVEAVKTISNYEQISPEDTTKLIIAAWFHDAGYIDGSDNHEVSSVKIAAEFLAGHGCSEEFIKEVSDLILATALAKQPQTELEKIVCDADYFHFGSGNYFVASEILREEWRLTQQKTFTDLEWAKENMLMFTQRHQFYTSFAKSFWQPVKDKNVAQIEKIVKKLVKNPDKAADKNKSSKDERPERGIDTLFRVTLNNHTRLSEIADSKANILLSVNAIIISIVLSTLIPKLDSPNNSHLVWPTFVLVIFSVITIIFAILSTRPKVTTGTFTEKDKEERKINLLFFGIYISGIINPCNRLHILIQNITSACT